MNDFFRSFENRIYIILSTLLTTATLLFIAPQSTSLVLFDFNLENKLFYGAFLVLGVFICGSILYFTHQTHWKTLLTKGLLITLPGALILTYGLSESKNFHYIFQIAVGVYVILAGILFSALYIERERSSRPIDPEAQSPKAWVQSQGLPSLILVATITSLFFLFSLHNLTRFAAVDEALWYQGRIGKYWNNIAERDWKSTRISDKPGITIPLAVWPGIFSFEPKSYKNIDYLSQEIGTTSKIERYYFAFRFPLLVHITLLLPLFYFFLERLFGRRNALISYALLALSPVLIGMSKIVNPDALLWVFTPLSLISYLVFLKRSSFRYLIFSGILLGLALLTKYVSNILFVFFLGLIFLEYLYHPKVSLRSLTEHLRQSLLDLLLLTFVALTTFYILFPATWVKPEKLLSSTLGSQAFEKVAPLFLVLIGFILIDRWLSKSRITSEFLRLIGRYKHWIAAFIGGIFLAAIVFVVGNTWLGMHAYDFPELLSSPKTIKSQSDFLGIFLTNFYPLIFDVTPIVFLCLFAAPFFFLKKQFSESVALRTSFYFIIFILLYFLGTTVNNIAAITRYQIILFPLTAIIAGVTLEHLLVLAHQKLKINNLPTPVVVTLIVVFFGVATLFLTPFPLSYANSFLSTKYHTDIKDMGAGSYEVAMYLNALPDARSILVWTDKTGVCRMFVGRCKSNFDYLDLREEGIDYIVVSAGRKSRTTKMMSGAIFSNKPGLIRFDQYYDRTDTTYEININDRTSHYVKVFKFKP